MNFFLKKEETRETRKEGTLLQDNVKKLLLRAVFFTFLTPRKSLFTISTPRLPKNQNPELIADRLSSRKTHFYLDACLVFRSMWKKSIRRLRISVIIFCEIAERVASPGASGNGTIHRFVATLFSARTLSILRDLRYYTTSSTSNSTLSLRDFGHKFFQAPSSTLTPTLLDL